MIDSIKAVSIHPVPDTRRSIRIPVLYLEEEDKWPQRLIDLYWTISL